MPGERRLDVRSLAELDRFLRSRHAELIERVRSLAATPGAWQTEMEAAQLDRLSRQIAGMEAALERLGREDYGWCDECGGFIGLARLKALPFARRCPSCQSQAETVIDWLRSPQEPVPIP
jgi:RNA polymerase-binding transcription factor DksA